MLITAKDLLSLPVYTESGQFLGRVVDFEINIDSRLILKYHVKTGGLISGLFGRLLIIDHQQVVSVSKGKIIVKDSLARDKFKKPAEAKLGVPAGLEVRSELIDTD